MFLGVGTRRDEVVQELEAFIGGRQQLEALYATLHEQVERVGDAEAGLVADAADDLGQQATEMQEKFFLGEATLEQVSAVKRQYEQAKTVSRQHEERLAALQEAVRETEQSIQQLRNRLNDQHQRLKTSLPDAFTVHFDQNRLWKVRRDDELGWRKRAFLFLFGYVLTNRDGVADLSFLQALKAFFSEIPFRVWVVKGFRYVEPQENGPPRILIYNRSEELVAVPQDLSFEHAFEEICIGRAVFIPE